MNRLIKEYENLKSLQEAGRNIYKFGSKRSAEIIEQLKQSEIALADEIKRYENLERAFVRHCDLHIDDTANQLWQECHAKYPEEKIRAFEG